MAGATPKRKTQSGIIETILAEVPIQRGFAGLMVPESKQLPDFKDNKRVITPRYDPSTWAALVECSTRFKRCISILAHNTVGLGYSVGVDEALHDRMVDSEKFELEFQKEQLQLLLATPNPEVPFDTVLNLVKTDHESTGNGYLEMTRRVADGKPGGLFHAQSAVTRITADDPSLFVQKKYTRDRYFIPWGSDLVLNPGTGKPLNEAGMSEEDIAKAKASEMIHFKIYSPYDPVYGVPRASTADIAIQGLNKVDLRNVDFFDFEAMPRIIIAVEGGVKEDMEGLEDKISNFIAQNRGNTKSSRILYVQARAGRDGKSPKITIHELGKYDRDATFSEYRHAKEEEIREAFGIAKVFFGTADDVNRASAMVTAKATIENIFWPETLSYSYRLTQCIAREFHPALKIELQKADITDASLQAEIIRVYGSDLGVLTVNEVREFIGWEKLDDDRADVAITFLRNVTPEEQQKAELDRTLNALEQQIEEVKEAKAAVSR